MTTAFRADGLAAEGTIFDGLGDIVNTVTVVERAHNYKVCLATARAGFFIDNMVAGMALVPAFFNRDIFEGGVFLFEGKLFRRPVHGNILSKRNDKSMGVPV